MVALIAFVIAIAGAAALAFIGVPLLAWTGAVAVYLAILYALGAMGPIAGILVGALFVLLAVLFNVRPLRRRLVTRGVFEAFKKALPPMNATEREALEAGDTWWEGELFQGRPDWDKLLGYQVTRVSDEEQRFLDNEVEVLCAMLDEDRIVRRDHDLPAEAWDYIRKQGFFGLTIPERYGGRAFSSLAQSSVVSKIATRSISAAVTVMVPNSLGPGELLMQYGTQAQRDRWLPGLASGEEIPCFALTGPDVGSDAGSMPDNGVVCKGEHEGREVLGIRLNFHKRYITLAPVATVLGLAFKLYDPDHLLGQQDSLGITCALIPAERAGVEIGRRHFPMGLAFMNGPIRGKDVFIPLDWIIGGPEMAGRGWRMLVECLSVGRAISLPALGTAAGKVAYRMTGDYAAVRRQFKLPIGAFEGVQEAMGRIAGLTYTLEASRVLTASAGDMGVKPSVVSGIAKYHMTEMMRQTMNDAMDVHGGRGIMFGPRNYLGYGYQAVPVGITVEGANILTRNLMIFGQGAIRCHPFVFAEMQAARDPDPAAGLAAFDRLLFRHVGYSINRGVRAFVHALTGSKLAPAPAVNARNAGHYRQLARMSSALALVADVAMAMLGGQLKRKERLSARLGDVLSQLYLASAVLKYHYDAGEPEAEQPHVDWAVGRSLAEAQKAFDGLFANFPARWAARLLRFVVFPVGRAYRPADDRLDQSLAQQMMQPGGVRERLGTCAYWGKSEDDASGRMEAAFALLQTAQAPYKAFSKAVASGKAGGLDFDSQLEACREQGLLCDDEAELVARYERLRRDAIATDDFDPSEFAPARASERRSQSRVA